MYPRRDALGDVQRLRQYRAGEPAPATEAVHSTPRKSNIRFTASTGLHDASGQSTASLNPDKVTSSAPYTAKAAPRRRQLPKPPSPEKQRSRDFVDVRERFYDPRGLTPQTAAQEQFSAPSGPTDSYDTSAPARQPLSQSSIGSRSFHDPVPALIRMQEQDPDSDRPPWCGTYGYSEREPIGKLPNNVVGKHGDQIKDFHQAQEFVASLRVENDDKRPDQWWRPLSVRDKRPSDTEEQVTTSGGAKFTTHDDMPSVFQRLTDPKRFNGTHKHRFADDGVGMGLAGRREDEHHRRVIAGQAVITRDVDPEMDSPNKPVLAWDSSTRASSRASTRPSTRPTSRNDSRANGDLPEVFQRLCRPAPRAGDGNAQYETKVKVAQQYGVVRGAIPRWQSGI